MPVEIKELHIKAIVTGQRSGHDGARDHDAKNEYDKMRKEIIKDCIEKILQLLEDKKER